MCHGVSKAGRAASRAAGIMCVSLGSVGLKGPHGPTPYLVVAKHIGQIKKPLLEKQKP